jgi:hypothetical protein
MNDLLVLALGWLVVLMAFLSFLSLRRYLEHRERMAMIARGITPPERHRSLSQPMFIRRAGVLQAGLITAMVGLALTLGLYPIGFYVPLSLVGPYHLGPWLLAGLIPLAVGGALILGHYLTPGRPMELPATHQAGRLDRQAPDELETGEASHTFPPRVGPIALPEARRWSSYRRAAGQPAEPEEPGGEDLPDGPLPRANA